MKPEDKKLIDQIQEAIKELEIVGVEPIKIEMNPKDYKKIQRFCQECFRSQYTKLDKNVKIKTIFGLEVMISNEIKNIEVS
jgi:hypothetical protein